MIGSAFLALPMQTSEEGPPSKLSYVLNVGFTTLTPPWNYYQFHPLGNKEYHKSIFLVIFYTFSRYFSPMFFLPIHS